jgi:cytochrome P450
MSSAYSRYVTLAHSIDTDKLVFHESFITELVRMNSYESSEYTKTTFSRALVLKVFLANVHRVARYEYTFADGYTVPKGYWAEFSQQSVFSDPTIFPNPKRYDPYRHLRTGRKLKDVSMEWPMWKPPRLSC